MSFVLAPVYSLTTTIHVNVALFTLSGQVNEEIVGNSTEAMLC